MRNFFLTALILFSITAPAQKFKDLALTPPMGWNSWNKFECDGINEKVIKEVADALVNNGMKKAGYEFIVIDDCWQIGRDSLGNILADPIKFPSGIKSLADYIHKKGLKFGIYTCAGIKTCAGRPGSRGYEYQDARQYAKWGVDYLKEDWCNTSTQDATESYTLMNKAIEQAGRPMILSLCEWGLSKPWLWAKDIAHCWRTTGDIRNNWDIADAKEGKVWAGGVVINLDMQKGLEKYAGPGHWNDPDMLEVGNGALTVEEERAHFSLWCMLAAPLMAGNDIRNMTRQTLEIITNREAIEVDQDRLGMQGYKILDEDNFEIFMKPLANGDTAICLFNRGPEKKQFEINWAHYKISKGKSIYDIWKHTITGSTNENYKIMLNRHDVIMLRLGKK